MKNCSVRIKVFSCDRLENIDDKMNNWLSKQSIEVISIDVKPDIVSSRLPNMSNAHGYLGTIVYK